MKKIELGEKIGVGWNYYLKCVKQNEINESIEWGKPESPCHSSMSRCGTIKIPPC
jgi:hypothetical protein